MKRIILASASPRRKQLLESVGYEFDVIHPTICETIDCNLSPNELAEKLAFLKASNVASQLNKGIVIGADTIVFLGESSSSKAIEKQRGEIVGKPKSRDDAIAILTKLSGTRHAVITGICIIDVEHGTKVVGSDTTWITMAKMSQAEIEQYIDSGESMGKAGAYAIQETGDRYVEKVEGSLSNVVGLPLELLKTMMAKISLDL